MLCNKKYIVSKESTDQFERSGKGIIISLITVDQVDLLKNLADQENYIQGLNPEGFRIIKQEDNEHYYIIGKDKAGLMYGGMELAEVINTGGLNAVKNTIQNPYMIMRGTKFNIPLDVRTPSYSDVSDAAQNNIPEMWSLDFWKEYIDSLASYRYNFISLWSLHPFPSLVKVPEYPDIALDDVHRSTTNWNEFYSLQGNGFDDPEIVNNYEVVKKMTIEEKIKFWQEVMRHGKNRNVDFYFVTWNIFTNGTFGKYGITDEIDNEITRNYFRQSVKQMFLTYPELAGIGMEGADFKEKEDWAFETYARGVMDAAELQPDRKIKFIHRQHQTGALDIADKFAPLLQHPNIIFIFSFKYAKAHVFSSTRQVFHQEFVNDIQSRGDLKTIWTLRNDDAYYFRWGAPDFVREFIKNIPYEVSEGYYYGSDQYVWGREFLERYPDGERQIELAKHWYHWMMWGRLGYNPDLENERFIKLIQHHFPKTDAHNLFNAWQLASMIYPLTTGFHWGSLDFQWYIEAGKSRPGPANTPSGYHDINRFISLPPHKGTDNISIPEYLKMKKEGVFRKGTTPLQLADKIISGAEQALQMVKEIQPNGNKSLYRVAEDIKAMAYLGKYYANKIIAATNLAAFRQNCDAESQEKMIKHLNLSALNWRYYASTASGRYLNPLWTNRVGYVDWKEIYEYVLYDITANGGNVNIPDMQPSANGTILEAEDYERNLPVSSEREGYTGSGYVQFPWNIKEKFVRWSYKAPEAGKYIIEVRYMHGRNENHASGIFINNSRHRFDFWNSGGENWVWDRMEVELNEGKNIIKLDVPGGVLIDHLNLLKL